MGPKVKFSKEQIIDAAFELAREKGLKDVTLRKVAEKLGSSVAPIYVNFKDSDELLKEVAMKAQTIEVEMCSIAYTERPFLNIGIGCLKFASEYSMIFNSQCHLNTNYKQKDKREEEVMLEQMKNDKLLEGFSDEELKDMLLKMSIFTYGLASMTAQKLLPPEYDEAMLIDLMSRTGYDIIMAARIKKESDNHETDNY